MASASVGARDSQRVFQDGTVREQATQTETKIPLSPVCTFLKDLLALSSGELTLHLRVLQTEGTAPLDPHVTITNRFLWQVLLSQAWFCSLGWLLVCLRKAGFSVYQPHQAGGRLPTGLHLRRKSGWALDFSPLSLICSNNSDDFMKIYNIEISPVFSGGDGKSNDLLQISTIHSRLN